MQDMGGAFAHDARIDGLAFTLEGQKKRLRNAALQRLFTVSATLERLRNRFENRHPARALQIETQRLRHLRQRLGWQAERRLRDASALAKGLSERLRALSPAATLARGFAYVTVEGAPVLSARSLKAGQRFAVRMRDGRVDATAETVWYDEEGK